MGDDFFTSLALMSSQEIKQALQEKYSEVNSKQICSDILCNINSCLVKGECTEYVKLLTHVLQVVINNYSTCDDVENTTVITACKYNRVNTLEYILTNILPIMSTSPSICDSDGHNAFYYALKTKNTKLVNILTEKWPNQLFGQETYSFEQLISGAYEELMLKNVNINCEMEIFVQNKLLRHHLVSEEVQQINFVFDVRRQFEILLDLMQKILAEYKLKEVDQKFVFLLKTMAKQIFNLKSHVKRTYNQVPWEEMEFCLVSFISAVEEKEKRHLFSSVILTQAKLVGYLESFNTILTVVYSDLDGILLHGNDYPHLDRLQCIDSITASYPALKSFYFDFQWLMDIYCLEKLLVYISEFNSKDPKMKDPDISKLMTLRIIHVLSMYLQEELYMPRMSRFLKEYLICALDGIMQEYIQCFSTMSQVDWTLKRLKLEDDTELIYMDVKKVEETVNTLLNSYKASIYKALMNNIITSDNKENVLRLIKLIQSKGLASAFIECDLYLYLEMSELLEEYKKVMKFRNTTKWEDTLVEHLDTYISFETNHSQMVAPISKLNFSDLARLVTFSDLIPSLDDQTFHKIKNIARVIQNCNRSMYVARDKSLKKISEYLVSLCKSVSYRIAYGSDDFQRDAQPLHLIMKMMLWISFEYENIDWVEAAKRDIANYCQACRLRTCKKSFPKSNLDLDVILKSKLTLLKQHLTKLDFNKDSKPTSRTLRIKEEQTLPISYELLLLDILFILQQKTKTTFQNAYIYEDHFVLCGPLLIHYLQYDAPVVRLFTNPVQDIILNIQAMSEDSVVKDKFLAHYNLNPIDFDLINIKFETKLAFIEDNAKMFFYALSNDVQKVKSFVSKGADISARSFQCLDSLLHVACKVGNVDFVHWICSDQFSFNVNEGNALGQRALHYAIIFQSLPCLTELLRHSNLFLNASDLNLRTPLHAAAFVGNREIFELLYAQNKSHKPFKDNMGCTATHYAVTSGQLELVRLLLDNDSNVDSQKSKDGFTFLHAACREGHLQVIEYLICKKADPNVTSSEGLLPIHLAVIYENFAIVEFLLRSRLHVSARIGDGDSLLDLACLIGNVDIIKLLLQNGADVNQVNNKVKFSPLIIAAYMGYNEAVLELLNYNPIINHTCIHGMTALHIAVRNESADVVSSLLDKGALLYKVSLSEKTVMHTVAETGNLAILNMLLQRRGNVNLSNPHLYPIHFAARSGKADFIAFLLDNVANLDRRDRDDFMTPLHWAAQFGHTDCVKVMLERGFNIDIRNLIKKTPLYFATDYGHAEVINYLIEKGANVKTRNMDGKSCLHLAAISGNLPLTRTLVEEKRVFIDMKCIGYTPLVVAVIGNHLEVTQFLIDSGANPNTFVDGECALHFATENNNVDICRVLLPKCSNVNALAAECLTEAVEAGFSELAELLLDFTSRAFYGSKERDILYETIESENECLLRKLLQKNAAVTRIKFTNETPLHKAVLCSSEVLADLLIQYGADVNARNGQQSTPLHLAVKRDNTQMVDILLKAGARVDLKNRENETPLTLVTENSNFEIVHLLSKTSSKAEMTILHAASKKGNFKLVHFLIKQNINVHAVNQDGAKAIHIAADSGELDIVRLFLDNNLTIDELDNSGKSLLHYAAGCSNTELLEFLVIHRHLDVNSTDAYNNTPLHRACELGNEKIAAFLLNKGACYNIENDNKKTPLQVTRNAAVKSLLVSIEHLFESVKKNNRSDVQRWLNKEVVVNARNRTMVTSLFYAAWKGYTTIVSLLLSNQADPNLKGEQGCTPLHYAAKYGHTDIVKKLLAHGAVYNAKTTNSFQTPFDFANKDDIKNVLTLISLCFKNIEEQDSSVLTKINKTRDIPLVQAVMNAKNEDRESLLVFATRNNCPFIDDLKQVLQEDSRQLLTKANELYNSKKWSTALDLYVPLLENRKSILGERNPGILDIMERIADIHVKKSNHFEALFIYKKALELRAEHFGEKNREFLNAMFTMNMVFDQMGESEGALEVLRETYESMKDLLHPLDLDRLRVQSQFTILLNKLKRFDEAFEVGKDALEKYSQLNYNKPDELSVLQNVMAKFYSKQNKYQEALNLFQKVYNFRKVDKGEKHAETLETLSDIGDMLSKLGDHEEALCKKKILLNLQCEIYGPKSEEVVKTLAGIGSEYIFMEKYHLAVKLAEKMQRSVKDQGKYAKGMELIDFLKSTALRCGYDSDSEDDDDIDLTKHEDAALLSAVKRGDKIAAEKSLVNGAHVNTVDSEGRTALHFAVFEGNKAMVNLLLKNGANGFLLSAKGNSVLHTAATKGNGEIMRILLEHLKKEKKELVELINRKTPGKGTSALHVAAQNGYESVVKLLLAYGAYYNILNNENKTPLNLSSGKNDIVKMLKEIDEIFKSVLAGSNKVMAKLHKVKPELRNVFLNTRDQESGLTIMETAQEKNLNSIIHKISSLLKE